MLKSSIKFLLINIIFKFITMGHDHHEPFKVPHYSEYNHWRSIPELANYNKRLERVGLKDPWIR